MLVAITLLLAICRPSGCTVASGVVGVVVVVGVCNRSQMRTSKCTCLIFGVSIAYLFFVFTSLICEKKLQLRERSAICLQIVANSTFVSVNRAGFWQKSIYSSSGVNSKYAIVGLLFSCLLLGRFAICLHI